jgi:hypothetical protein
MSAESPTSSEEKKPDTLFIRCSVVVIGIFTAASVLVTLVLPAIILDRRFRLFEGALETLPVFSSFEQTMVFLLVCIISLQFLWWICLTFCYICGKYDQVAEKYDELELFPETPSGYPFPFFPSAFTVFWIICFFIILIPIAGFIWVWELVF